MLAGGVPLNDPFGGWVYWGRVPQAAIDRIEVVRGGISDLYGADAVGGVIHIIPMSATRSAARGSIEGGSLDTNRVSLFGGGHRNRLGATLAVERLSTDGAVIVDESARGPIDTPAGVRHSDAARVRGLARGDRARASRRACRASARSARTARRSRTTTPTSGSTRSADRAMCCGGAWQARRVRHASDLRPGVLERQRDARGGDAHPAPARAQRDGGRQRRLAARVRLGHAARGRGAEAGRRQDGRDALRFQSAAGADDRRRPTADRGGLHAAHLQRERRRSRWSAASASIAGRAATS